MNKEKIQTLITNKNYDEIKTLINNGEIVIYKKKLYTKDDYTEMLKAKQQEELFDLYQLVKKILLNSAYGATINQFCRFYDPRLGASCTSTGRQITMHMIETAGELITGQRCKVEKTIVETKDGTQHKYKSALESIIYGDTDSVYFLTHAKDKKEAVLIADSVGEGINDSFPNFMRSKFLCSDKFDTLIAAGREIVGSRGIWQAKKKYMIRVVDLDGKSVPRDSKKSLKAMGSEIKKSDTPKIIQKFLKNVVDKTLDGATYNEIEEYVNTSRKKIFNFKNILDIGVSKSVNKLDSFYDEYCRYEKTGIKRVNLPGHVRAAINHNELVDLLNDSTTPKIISGSKIRVFYLKPNKYGFTNIALSSDLTKVPKWFTQNFEVDIEATEQKMIDAKLEGVFKAIGWEVPTIKNAFIKDLFEF